MAAGSVIVDMGASALGGNVAGSAPGQTVVTANGVTIIGATNLPATVPTAASNAFSRNISALLLHMTADGALQIDTTDEIQAGVVITRDGEVVQPAVAKLLTGQPPTRGSQPCRPPWSLTSPFSYWRCSSASRSSARCPPPCTRR